MWTSVQSFILDVFQSCLLIVEPNYNVLCDVGKLMALIYVYGAADMFNGMVQIICVWFCRCKHTLTSKHLFDLSLG